MRKAETRTATAAGRYNRPGGLSPASFVLMELLVVIAVIALLMAILLPTLSRIRRAAKAVACQANLHQWGLMFSMYTAANDGKFFAMGLGDTWIGPMQPYYGNCEDSLFLCPVAKTPYVRQPDRVPDDPAFDDVTKKRLWAWKFIGGGTTFHAWWLFEPFQFCSYGLNDWVMDRPEGPTHTDAMWRTSDVPDSSNVPVFLDCIWRGARPHDLDAPGADENYPPRMPLGADLRYNAMQYFCIDRHEAFINGLFMDGSARQVGLKHLWTLRWHRYFDPNGPWTRAGGVQPGDWPRWMGRLRDY